MVTKCLSSILTLKHGLQAQIRNLSNTLGAYQPMRKLQNHLCNVTFFPCGNHSIVPKLEQASCKNNLRMIKGFHSSMMFPKKSG